MMKTQESYPKAIDDLLSLSKRLLALMEEKLGAPPPLSYLSTGYIGPDKFISDTTDIDSNLRRCLAILQSSPKTKRKPKVSDPSVKRSYLTTKKEFDALQAQRTPAQRRRRASVSRPMVIE